MSFIVDKQSLDDLNLLGKYRPGSVYSLFNQVKTEGGGKLLEAMFGKPLQCEKQINERSRLFRYFQSLDLTFLFHPDELQWVEKYSIHSGGGLLAACIGICRKKLAQVLVRSNQFETLELGIMGTINVLRDFKAFLQAFDGKAGPYQQQWERGTALLDSPGLASCLEGQGTASLPMSRLIRLHAFFSGRFRQPLRELLEMIYELDCNLAIAAVARERGLGYATAIPAAATSLSATGLRHPALNNAVGNPLALDKQHNLLFLTGANMAGKSTWMKTIGVNLYLAHLGFPVAATTFEFSVMEGIYSSINVPDNIGKGYSHFYAEVLRVKEVAVDVQAGKRLLVLFDELFKGTNVQDAYDATLAVMEAFAGYRECLFVVSTHIIEVGEALSARTANTVFSYLPTVMDGARPRYTYRLTPGITSDRQGMMIIENEGILNIINGKQQER